MSRLIQGQGGIPAIVSQLPHAVVSLTEQIEAATGVDILASVRADTEKNTAIDEATSDDSSALPPPPPAIDD